MKAITTFKPRAFQTVTPVDLDRTTKKKTVYIGGFHAGILRRNIPGEATFISIYEATRKVLRCRSAYSSHEYTSHAENGRRPQGPPYSRNNSKMTVFDAMEICIIIT